MINSKPEIITGIKNLQELLDFIIRLDFKNDNKETENLILQKKPHDRRGHLQAKTLLVIEIIGCNLGAISDLTKPRDLSTFFKNLDLTNYDDDKKYLVLEVIEKNPDIIKDLTNSKSLLNFITELGITDAYCKEILAIQITDLNNKLNNFTKCCNYENVNYNKIENLNENFSQSSSSSSSSKTSNKIQPSGFSQLCDFLKKLNPFYYCQGN